jgi:hypothetical protein
MNPSALKLTAIGIVSVLLTACGSIPDDCSAETTCGYMAYSEERTVEFEKPEAPAPMVVEEVVVEEEVTPTPPPAPAPVMEEPAPAPAPVRTPADDVFDKRLSK